MKARLSMAMAMVLSMGLAGCGQEDTAKDVASVDATETTNEADSTLVEDTSDVSQELFEADVALADLVQPVETVFSKYTADGKVVEFVDLQRYLGKWYEIATFEIVFQTDCTGSTATYGLNEDGTISVTNECFLKSLDGEYKVDVAVAEIDDPVSNAKLLVQFPGAPKAPYWIIELDGQDGEGEYEWAVVGSSFPIFLWILSRTPQVPPERMEAIKQRLIERGYDLSELSYTVQSM